MKSFGLILQFIFLCCTCFSQDTEIIHIDSLPAEGFLLDKGWKFQPGDNPDYANADYDDSKWQSINPTVDIRDSLPQIPSSGIVWFRLHFAIDSNIVQKPLALIVHQSGASEIYLNGHLIQRYGILNSDEGRVRAYDPLGSPFSLPLTTMCLMMS